MTLQCQWQCSVTSHVVTAVSVTVQCHQSWWHCSVSAVSPVLLSLQCQWQCSVTSHDDTAVSVTVQCHQSCCHCSVSAVSPVLLSLKCQCQCSVTSHVVTAVSVTVSAQWSEARSVSCVCLLRYVLPCNNNSGREVIMRCRGGAVTVGSKVLKI